MIKKLVFILLMAGVCAAQSIDPSQIKWGATQFITAGTAGSDACVKIANAITALPSAGGSVDARGLQGAQSCAADPFAGVGTKKVVVELGVVTISSSVAWSTPSYLVLVGQNPLVSVIAFTGSAAGFASTAATSWVMRGIGIDSTATSSFFSIFADASSSDYTIDNIRVKANASLIGPVVKGEIYLQGSGVNVRNNTFDGLTFVACYQCNGGGFLNNKFYNYVTGVDLFETQGTSERNVVVTGNEFLSVAAGTATNGQDAILVESSQNVAVTGNVIKAAMEHCIYVSDGSVNPSIVGNPVVAGSYNVTVTGNTCSGFGATNGIQVRGNFNGVGSYNRNIIVKGNTIKGDFTGSKTGASFFGTMNLLVEGNSSVNNKGDGFYFDNLITPSITGNTASGNGSAGLRFGDDQNVGPSSGMIIKDNISTNNNLNGNGFSAFHFGYSHGFTHAQFNVGGNHAANTLPNVAITSVVRASNVVTVTTAVPHLIPFSIPLAARLVIAGVTDGTFNTTLSNVAVTVVDATHYTYPQTAADATSSGGTIQPKTIVNGFSSALSGGSTIDVLTLGLNTSNNLVSTMYSATLNATAAPQLDTQNGLLNTNVQINSTLAIGTAPLAVVSTTPVANLTASNHPRPFNCGGTTTCSNTLATSGRVVYGTVALTAGTATITGITAFTSSASFVCTGTDITAAAAVKIVNASSSSITITGTGTDTINYVCVGN